MNIPIKVLYICPHYEITVPQMSRAARSHHHSLLGSSLPTILWCLGVTLAMWSPYCPIQGAGEGHPHSWLTTLLLICFQFYCRCPSFKVDTSLYPYSHVNSLCYLLLVIHHHSLIWTNCPSLSYLYLYIIFNNCIHSHHPHHLFLIHYSSGVLCLDWFCVTKPIIATYVHSVCWQNF